MTASEEDLMPDFDDEEVNAVADVDEPKAKTGGTTYSGVRISGFKDFLLKPELNRAIQDCAFEHPSEVQHQCIPQAILGQDILCQAKSGMGKTAVFVLSVLQQLETEGQDAKAVQCLVLGHVHELAYQIANEFTRFAKFFNEQTEPKRNAVHVAVFYGGQPVAGDRAKLDKSNESFPSIVVGTPGRVAQLVRENVLDLKRLKFFVLDECDNMLKNLDMRQSIQDIFIRTPKQKQVMMFSATMPTEVRKVAKLFMQKPVEVYVDSEAKLTLHGLQQYYVKVTEAEKNKKLTDTLDVLEFNQVVIFVKSVNRAIQLSKLLRECNFPALCIHGSMKQEERISVYTEFKEFKCRILVCTDIFARGIDIERVNIVINYDMTEDLAYAQASDTYLHRVGRAGRFGTKGLAITFIGSQADEKALTSVQQRFAVEVTEMPAKIETSTYMQAG